MTAAPEVVGVSAGSTARAASLSSSAAGVDWGVATAGGWRDLRQVTGVEAAVGRKVSIVAAYAGFADDGFDISAARAVAAHGALPMVTWEPWNHRRGSNQPAYALSRIIRGDYDPYLAQFGRALSSYHKPVLLRFAQEMNTRSYPWGAQVNGNTAEQFIEAWRHVRSVVRAAGGTNAQWIWSPSVAYPGTTPFAAVYPGDAYVDWVALDGYNGGTALPWGGWLTFDQVFSSSLRQLGALSTKPIMIAEVASAEAGGSKAAWVSDLFATLQRNPRIRAFVWFDFSKEADWRIQSSIPSVDSFRRGISDSRYRGALS